MKIRLIDQDGGEVAFHGGAVPREGDIVEVTSYPSEAARQRKDGSRKWFKVTSIRWHVSDDLDEVTIVAYETGAPASPGDTPTIK